MQVITAIIFFVCSIFFILLGYKFGRGQWLNLIAGNNFADKKTFEEPRQRLLGKSMSKAMYAGAVSILIHAISIVLTFFDIKPLDSFVFTAAITSYICTALIMVWAFRKSNLSE